MVYTNTILFLGGVLGILFHNLKEINVLNKVPENNFKLWQYLGKECYSILMSVITVTICVVAKNEISELESAGKLLFLGFVTIGYSGQSVLIFLLNKLRKLFGIDMES